MIVPERFARRRPTGPSAPAREARDRGSALPLVLVLIVIASLIILPTLTYAVSVLGANSVLSAKTHRIEAVKGGLRVALAEPSALYKACADSGQTLSIRLADSELNGETVSTECYTIELASSQSAEEMRFGVATTRVGFPPPAGLAGNAYVPTDPTSTTEWQDATTLESETDKIWLPNLPVHALSPRSPVGSQMADGFPTCTVYFPGTYVDTLTLTGPTFFTSGIYYFERDIRIAAGASVVVGDGARPGCTSSQEAVFYALNVPSTHNIAGLGGTWVLGANARVLVDNALGDVSLQFNTRYASPDDPGDAPSQDVSIISVNGELAPDGVTGIDLDISDTINVPLSLVGSVDPVSATGQEYEPSLVTPRERVPAAPSGVVAQPFSTSARVTWTAPFDGGSPITGYVVTASSGQTCTTNGATVCVVRGLPNSTSRSFSVVATNAVGSSPPSAPSANVTIGGSTLTAPVRPAAPTANAYADVVRVGWTAVAPPLSPVTRYTVTASPGDATCVVDMTTSFTPELACDFAGLDALLVPGYQFTVTATNAVGDSTASPPSAVVQANGVGAPVPIPGPPEPPEFVPPAIIDIDLTGSAAAVIDIPGYVSVPQGRVNLNNPAGLDVRIAGGLLASQLDIVDGRPEPIPVGLENPVVQRKLRIVSRIAGKPEVSTAVVQINQNGAYAINSWEVQSVSDDTVTEPTPTTTEPPSTTVPPPPPSGPCNVSSDWTRDFGAGAWVAEFWNRSSFSSPPSNPFSGTPSVAGNVTEVFKVNNSGAPASGVNADYYTARFTKTVTASTACTIRLRRGSDDGVRIKVNGVTVVDDWNAYQYKVRTHENIALNAGENTIVFEYYEQTGESGYSLEWSS